MARNRQIERFRELDIETDELLCPQCKRGRGGKGLELRPRLKDAYCHSCKKAWPLKLKVVISETSP